MRKVVVVLCILKVIKKKTTIKKKPKQLMGQILPLFSKKW